MHHGRSNKISTWPKDAHRCSRIFLSILFKAQLSPTTYAAVAHPSASHSVQGNQCHWCQSSQPFPQVSGELLCIIFFIHLVGDQKFPQVENLEGHVLKKCSIRNKPSIQGEHHATVNFPEAFHPTTGKQRSEWEVGPREIDGNR